MSEINSLTSGAPLLDSKRTQLDSKKGDKTTSPEQTSSIKIDPKVLKKALIAGVPLSAGGIYLFSRPSNSTPSGEESTNKNQQQARTDTPKTAQKPTEPRTEVPKTTETRTKTPRATPKTTEPKANAPKTVPKAAEPRTEAPKVVPKATEPRVETPRPETKPKEEPVEPPKVQPQPVTVTVSGVQVSDAPQIQTTTIINANSSASVQTTDTSVVTPQTKVSEITLIIPPDDQNPANEAPVVAVPQRMPDSFNISFAQSFRNDSKCPLHPQYSDKPVTVDLSEETPTVSQSKVTPGDLPVDGTTSQEMTWAQQKWASFTESASGLWDRFSTSASGHLAPVGTGMKKGVTTVGDSYGSVVKMVDDGKTQLSGQVPVEVSLWPKDGICSKVPESAHETCTKTTSFFKGVYGSAADTAAASRDWINERVSDSVQFAVPVAITALNVIPTVVSGSRTGKWSALSPVPTGVPGARGMRNALYYGTGALAAAQAVVTTAVNNAHTWTNVARIGAGASSATSAVVTYDAGYDGSTTAAMAAVPILTYLGISFAAWGISYAIARAKYRAETA